MLPRSRVARKSIAVLMRPSPPPKFHSESKIREILIASWVFGTVRIEIVRKSGYLFGGRDKK